MLWAVWLHLVPSPGHHGVSTISNNLHDPGCYWILAGTENHALFLETMNRTYSGITYKQRQLIKQTDGTPSKAVILQCSQSYNIYVWRDTGPPSTIQCFSTYRREKIRDQTLQNLSHINNNISLSSTLKRIQLQNSKTLCIWQACHTRDESCERQMELSQPCLSA